jgi:receptor protein-tyrosine kinase
MAMQIERSKVIPVSGKGASENQIGALLIDAGKIIPQDAERVLRYAKEKNLRFGDAAIELGLATREEIERAIAVQFGYPYVASGESPVAPEVVAAYRPFSRQVEVLRALRSQLLLRWFGDSLDRKRLAVVSINHGDGRSYLAANLAVVFSQLGEHTLLVDADMRKPRQHQIFGLSNSIGLSTVLSGRAGTEAIHRIPAFKDLSILPAGPIPPNPQELLDRSAFTQAMDEWSRHFDVVLLDTSAASEAADARIVASKAEGAFILTRMNRSRLNEVKSFCEDLSQGGVTLVGSVINR